MVRAIHGLPAHTLCEWYNVVVTMLLSAYGERWNVIRDLGTAWTADQYAGYTETCYNVCDC